MLPVESSALQPPCAIAVITWLCAALIANTAYPTGGGHSFMDNPMGHVGALG